MTLKEGEIKGVKSRTVLWYLTFSGFAINYIIRINVPIAIVEMIDLNYKKTSANKTIISSECIIQANQSVMSEIRKPDNASNFLVDEKYVSMERRLLNYLGVSSHGSSQKTILISFTP